MLDGVGTHLYNKLVNTNKTNTWQTKETPKKGKYAHGSRKNSTLSSENLANKEGKTCPKSSATTLKKSPRRLNSLQKTMQSSLAKLQNGRVSLSKSANKSVSVKLSPVESYRLRKYAEAKGLTLEQALSGALGGCVPTSDGCVPTCEAVIALTL